jgi:predicted Abi (CAAX) family protease
VWIAVENAPAPHQDLIGHKVGLGWQNTASNPDRLARTVIDIHFDQRARDSQAKGNVHPVRLDGWRRVGPLESLAGARSVDDVRVDLRKPVVVGTGSQASLLIADEPRLVEGRRTALVAVVREVSHDASSARLRVRLYDPQDAAFMGPEVDMVFPRAAPIDAQHAPMTSVDDLASSPLNADGW